MNASPSRSIVANRLNQFATLYDPDAAESAEVTTQPADSPSRTPGRKGELRESTGSVHIALSNKQYGDYKPRLLARNPHCFYCGCHVTRKTSNIDHVLPVSRGGNNWPANLVLSCLKCNNDKAADTPTEWLIRIIAELERLSAVKETIETLLAENGLEFYAPTVPRGERVTRQAQSVCNSPENAAAIAKAKRDGVQQPAFSPADFHIGKKRFDVVRMSDDRRLIRNLSGTDVAHFLAAIGLDADWPCKLVCLQPWHIK